MQWILDNWVTVLLVGGFIGVHFFMHGHGGGHGNHGDKNDNSDGGDHQHDVDRQTPQSIADTEGEPLIDEVVSKNPTNDAKGFRKNCH